MAEWWRSGGESGGGAERAKDEVGKGRSAQGTECARGGVGGGWSEHAKENKWAWRSAKPVMGVRETASSLFEGKRTWGAVRASRGPLRSPAHACNGLTFSRIFVVLLVLAADALVEGLLLHQREAGKCPPGAGRRGERGERAPERRRRAGDAGRGAARGSGQRAEEGTWSQQGNDLHSCCRAERWSWRGGAAGWVSQR